MAAQPAFNRQGALQVDAVALRYPLEARPLNRLRHSLEPEVRAISLYNRQTNAVDSDAVANRYAAGCRRRYLRCANRQPRGSRAPIYGGEEAHLPDDSRKHYHLGSA